jgi:hypothetical protein
MERNSKTREKMKKLLGLVVLTLGVMLVGSPKVMADDTFCPPSCFLTGPVAGDIKVLSGGSLFALAASVSGSIQVEPGGSITIADSTVNSDIKGEGAVSCTVIATMGGGDV